MGFSARKSGFGTMESLLNSVADDLLAAGFTSIHDSRGTTGVIILESGPTVDPLSAEQPWRIALDGKWEVPLQQRFPITTFDLITLDSLVGRICVGTPFQLKEDGTLATLPIRTKVVTDPDYHRSLRTSGAIEGLMSPVECNYARPCSYQLTVSDRGMVLSITTDAQPEGRGQFWIAIQRLANAKTGEVMLEGPSPVVCFFFKEQDPNSVVVNQGTSQAPDYFEYFEGVENKAVRQIVVREADVHAPTDPVDVTAFGNYQNENVNNKKQISISNNDEYVVSIPDGITTNRHLYHSERMDMIGFISANVISENTVAEVSMHGEPIPRKYTAQRCTGGTNLSEDGYTEGSRLLVLTENGGI